MGSVNMVHFFWAITAALLAVVVQANDPIDVSAFSGDGMVAAEAAAPYVNPELRRTLCSRSRLD
jgi:hypothetical protein